MQLGVIGLGRIGANIVRRLMKNGHECVVFNRSHEKVKQLAQQGATGTYTLDDFVQKLTPPRAISLSNYEGYVEDSGEGRWTIRRSRACRCTFSLTLHSFLLSTGAYFC